MQQDILIICTNLATQLETDVGHQRLGDIPKTRKWSEVIASIGGGADTEGLSSASISVANVAQRTLDAAGSGLQKAIDDAGLKFTFYLLTQLVLVARETDWRDRLKGLGISLQDDSSLFDLTCELQSAVDSFIERNAHPSDVSEMAQQAASEAIAGLAGSQARTLFGSGNAELQDAVRELSTKAGFAKLGQRFFGCFMSRFLNFYLSRVSAAHVGTPPLSQVGELTQFNEQIAHHCYQSARIVRDFCGEWYSKTEFQQGINLANTSSFMAVALQKLQAELEKQKEGR